MSRVGNHVPPPLLLDVVTLRPDDSAWLYPGQEGTVLRASAQ